LECGALRFLLSNIIGHVSKGIEPILNVIGNAISIAVRVCDAVAVSIGAAKASGKLGTVLAVMVCIDLVESRVETIRQLVRDSIVVGVGLGRIGNSVPVRIGV
jgi:hypothetical protein